MKWNLLARGATRWWSAPARFPTAPLALVRKAVLHRHAAHETWLHQPQARNKPQWGAALATAVPPR
jgi:hypothetical protein